MLAVISCLAGVFLLLLAADFLWRKKILQGEDHRKFTHITVGTFAAFWPWILTWKEIQLIALSMAVVVLINRYVQVLHLRGINKQERETYGDVMMALAILMVALLTTNKVFFAIAILNMSLADGFAAVVGKHYGKHWKYKVFHQDKTVIGSMTFWFISLCIIAAGLLFVTNLITFTNYILLVLFLPPLLTIVENVTGLGLDNIFVPLIVILVLNAARIG